MHDPWYIVVGKNSHATYCPEHLLQDTLKMRLSEPAKERVQKINVVKIQPRKLAHWKTHFDPQLLENRTNAKPPAAKPSAEPPSVEESDRELTTLIAESGDYYKDTGGRPEDDWAKLIEYEIIALRGYPLRQVSKVINEEIDNVAFDLGGRYLQKGRRQIFKRAKREVIGWGLENALRGRFKTHALDITDDFNFEGTMALLPLVDSESELPDAILEFVVRSDEPGEESAVLLWNLDSKSTFIYSPKMYNSHYTDQLIQKRSCRRNLYSCCSRGSPTSGSIGRS
jgi:hypothetical protein